MLLVNPGMMNIANADDQIVVSTTENNIRIDRYEASDTAHQHPISRISAMPIKKGLAAGVATTSNISQHGGPVMISPNVYVIYYGNWASTSCTDSFTQNTNSTSAIINDFISSVGTSSWYGINMQYYSGTTTKTYVTNVVNYAPSKCILDNYSQGASLDAAGKPQVSAVVDFALSNNNLPVDANGIYFVIPSKDVAVSGFLTSFCGYHSYYNPTVSPLTSVKYSFVGDASNSLGSCAGQTASSPNSNPAADALISVLAHELVETVSDPMLNAWYDALGSENADKCAWTFGTTSAATGGGVKNMHIGSRDYLVQQNWIPTGTQTCGLSYAPAALAATSVASVSATLNKALTNTTLVTASGGTSPYTYSISPTLPTGLTFNTATAVLSGTPTQTLASTNYTVTVRDGASATITKVIPIQVTAAALSATASAAVYTMVGKVLAGSTLLTASGGTAPYTYSISGTLPAGLTFNTSNAVISGTPTAIQAATSFNVTVTDSSNASVTKAVTIQSSATLVATQAVANINAVRNVSITATTPVVGSASAYTAYTYSISPALPTGLTLTASSGRISGKVATTVAVGAKTYTITVTDAKKFTATNTFQITIS